jgi:hypothetical protein
MAKQAGQAQPPVVQQDLAQMMPRRPMPQGMPQGVPQGAPQAPQAPQQAAPQLPEEQGIGALPAENLQGMGHADGGIIGYKDKGLVDYKTLSDADINPILNQYQPQTPEELAAARSAIVNPMNAEMEASYKPFAEKLAKKEFELAGRKEGNIQNALLTAGLGMMAGTSPYAFANIGKGGLEGLQTYQAAEKADQASRDALDHSQMLMMQAQRAERAGNNRDATAMIDAAQRQREAHVAHGLTALQLKNTSQYQAGQLANTELQRQIEAGKASEAVRHDKALEDLYYTPMGQAAKNKQAISPNELLIAKADQTLNRNPEFLALGAKLKDPTMDVNSPEYDDIVKKMQKLQMDNYAKFKIDTSNMPDLTPSSTPTTAPKPGFFSSLFGASAQPLQRSPGMSELLANDKDSLFAPVDPRTSLPYSAIAPQ